MAQDCDFGVVGNQVGQSRRRGVMPRLKRKSKSGSREECGPSGGSSVSMISDASPQRMSIDTRSENEPLGVSPPQTATPTAAKEVADDEEFGFGFGFEQEEDAPTNTSAPAATTTSVSSSPPVSSASADDNNTTATNASLQNARAAANAALSSFSVATNKAEQSQGQDDEEDDEYVPPQVRARRAREAAQNGGPASTTTSPTRKGLPMGALLDDDDDAQDNNGQQEELTFMEMMDKALEIEGDEPGEASVVDEAQEPEKPPEDWEVWRAVRDNDAEEMAELVDLEADLNIRDQEGFTPLQRAADGNRTEMAAAMLKSKTININLQCENGTLWTALHIAALSGYPEFVKLITEHKPDYTVQCSRGETALQWAEANKEEECIAALKAAM